MKNTAAALVLFLALGGQQAGAQGRSAGTVQDASRSVAVPSSHETGGRSQSYTDAAPRAASDHASNNSSIGVADNYGGRSSSMAGAAYIAEGRNEASNMESAPLPSYSGSRSSGSSYRAASGGGTSSWFPRYAPYSSSEQSRDRSLRHCDSVRIQCCPIPQFIAQAPPWCYGPCYYAYGLPCNGDIRFRNDQDRQIEHPGSVLFKTFDGYIVHGKDTISGRITMDKQSAYIRPYTYEKYWNVNYQLNDPSISKIGLFYGTASLYYARIPGHAKVQRVIHSGKISIYDGKFDFLSADNINRNSIILASADNGAGTVNFSRNPSRQHLIDKVNAAYGLSIKSQDYSWPQLLSFIDQLH